MPDPISNKVAQQAANQASQQSANTQQQPTEVDADAQGKFEQVLNSPEGTQQANVQQTTGTEKVQGGQTLGDVILDGIEKIKARHDSRGEKVMNQLEAADGDMSVDQLLKLQFDIVQMNLEQELTGKIADKTSQGVQTLFKNQ